MVPPEYRLPGELRPAGRLEKSWEELRQLSKSARVFLSKYLKSNNRSEKGELANHLRYMVKKLKTVTLRGCNLPSPMQLKQEYMKKCVFKLCESLCKGYVHEKREEKEIF